MGKRAIGDIQLQNFTYFCSFRMYIMLLNLVHKFKCETNLTLIYVIPNLSFAMAMFWGPFLRACP